MLENLQTCAPAEPNSAIWRFMDFTKYVSMLHRRTLFFSRADQLPDPFEGAYARRNDRSEHEEASIRRRVCLSCWHQNEHESAAMWRIYLRSDDGIAIRSTVARLRDSLQRAPEKLILGKVRYLDYEEEAVPEEHRLDPFFCKRKSYEYEREVRVLWAPDDVVEASGRYVTVDLEKLVEQVVISPAAEPWFGELVESVTRKYGLRLDVAPSTLSEHPAARRVRRNGVEVHRS